MDWFTCVERPLKVKLCGDGTKPTQFAFVEFPNVGDAHEAIAITGTDCCGFSLKISQARGTIQTTSALSAENPPLGPEEQEIRSRTVYVNQLDAAMTEPFLRDWFAERCGMIKQIKLCGDQTQSTRYCFIEFDSLDGATKCKALAGSLLGNYQFKCSDSKVTLSKPLSQLMPTSDANPQQSRTVHVANLDRAITENDLRAFFEQCGSVSHTYIVAGESHQPVRYGFVEFFDASCTAKAFGLSGAVLGQYGIRVSQAKGVITASSNKAATLPGNPAPNTAAQEAMNTAYAAALQAENLKYQEYMAKKRAKAESGGGGGSDSDDDRRRKRRRRRSRSSSGERDRRRRRSRDRRRGSRSPRRRSRSRSGSRGRQRRLM